MTSHGHYPLRFLQFLNTNSDTEEYITRLGVFKYIAKIAHLQFENGKFKCYYNCLTTSRDINSCCYNSNTSCDNINGVRVITFNTITNIPQLTTRGTFIDCFEQIELHILKYSV